MTKLENLQPGDKHYKAYVGPPLEYDFMGATQFRLLTALGLRGHHKLLDFGCGSLRAGRLFIPYLDPGCYFGIEPEPWLVEEAFEKELGKEILTIKRPSFSHNRDFRMDIFDSKFDFILAQSIFSHAGRNLIMLALTQFKKTLSEKGLALATFYAGTSDHQGVGWVYPDIVCFTPESITDMIQESGLKGFRLPWYHPRQTWYIMSQSQNNLPSQDKAFLLNGFFMESRNLRKS